MENEAETEASDINNDEQESYVLTLTQKLDKSHEDDSMSAKENIDSSQFFEQCSQVHFEIYF